jgi:hypothetical protein
VTPTLAAVKSSKEEIENGRVGYFLFTKAKNDLALFSLRLY